MGCLSRVARAALLALLAAPAHGKTVAQARKDVVAGTMRYLNTPYLWGGAHPTTGLDCSGFTQLVYHDAGITLPRVAAAQFSSMKNLKPEEVRPGDLLFFAMKHPGTDRVDHVGIYLGKGLFVHASVTNGIHVEPVSKQYYLDRLVSIRKYKAF